MGDDKRDLDQLLGEKVSRIFDAIVNPSTPAEKKRAEKELAEHIARPGMADDIEQLAREFKVRLKGAGSLQSGLPAEYEEAFGPLLERMATIPPPDRQTVPELELWTQHMVRFCFSYGIEPLRALLGLKAFVLIAPTAAYFEAVTADPDDIERARRTREFVEMVEADVNRIVDAALGRFVEALSGRLNAVLDETISEIAVWAISELEGELNITGKKHVAKLRDHILKQWTKVEKVRIGTLAHGGNRSNADLSRLKEHYDAHIEAVKEAFEDCRDALLSRSQAKRQGWREAVKQNFPQLAEHDDLITLLQPATDWPDKLADVCIEKEIDSDPEHICLVLAARLCGAA